VLAAVAASAASAGDVLLLWFANGGRADLPMLPPLGERGLLAGHYLGVLAIPFYALGYWGLAASIRRAHPAAARWVFAIGALASAWGAAVHGITGMAEHLERAAGVPPRDPVAFFAAHGAYLVPLWSMLAALVAAGSLVFARAVAQGDTDLPRWMALANPLALIALAALLGAPTALGRAVLVPAAPNIAHVWLFALAAIVLGRARSSTDRSEPKISFPA
jgi:hypothetical protein